HGQLVRRDVLGDVHPLPVPFQVRAVPADPDHDVGAGQRERADLAGVDVADVADEGLQAGVGAFGTAVRGAEVEPAQPRHPFGFTAGDLVQHVFHVRGELVVDQLAEMPL